MRALTRVFLVVACLACLSAPNLGAKSAPRLPFDVKSCGQDIPGFESITNTKMLLLGEYHGMKAPPAFAADIACRLAVAGKHVMLGVEFPMEEQPRFDAFMASPGTGADREALLQGAFWRSSRQDGRASEARLEMLDRVRGWRQQGLQIRTVAFDTPGKDQQERELAMAQAILAARRPDETVVVLVGNLHARTRPGWPRDPNLVWMGVKLREAEPSLVSLDTRYAAGKAWACSPGCGPTTVPGHGRPNAWDIELKPALDENGYNGVFDTGVAQMSLPAVARRSRDKK